MLNRLKKLIVIGVLSVTTILSNTIVFAADETPTVTETPSVEDQQENSGDSTETTPDTNTETDNTTSDSSEPDNSETEDASNTTNNSETDASQTPSPEPEKTNEQDNSSKENQNSNTNTENNNSSAGQELSTQNTDASAASETAGVANSQYSSNEDLIAHQNIVSVQKSVKDFRFTQVEVAKSVLKAGSSVYEEKSDTSRKVGNTKEGSIVYILADEDEDWVFIESGECRGFVKNTDLIKGDVASFMISRNSSIGELESMVELCDNEATDYTKTSVYPVIVDKQYGIAKEDANIYDDTSATSGTVVGTISTDGLMYILKDVGTSYYVESDNVRGFISKDSVVTGDYADIKVNQKTESGFTYATEVVAPEDNKACYYTLTSVKEADDNAALRESIVNFALQFVGNPYVWGGTSLTNGADCSGFVQSIYANYGYSIPRVACDQAEYGTQISISDAEPGDLIFYAKQGYVYHVSMYIGNGQVVQAYSTKAGIITSEIGPNAVWATKVIG